MWLKLVWGIAGEIMYGLEQDWTVLVIVQDNQSWFGIWSGAWLHHGLGHSKSVWGIAGEAIYGPEQDWTVSVIVQDIQNEVQGWSGAWLHHGLGYPKLVQGITGEAIYGPEQDWTVSVIVQDIQSEVQGWSGTLSVRSHMVWSIIASWSGTSQVGLGNYWWGHIWSGARLNSIGNSPGHPEWSPRMVWDIVCEIIYGPEQDWTVSVIVQDIQSEVQGWSGAWLHHGLGHPKLVWGIAGEAIYGLEQDWTASVIVQDIQSEVQGWSGTLSVWTVSVIVQDNKSWSGRLPVRSNIIQSKIVS
jgi:hypothetical protein